MAIKLTNRKEKDIKNLYEDKSATRWGHSRNPAILGKLIEYFEETKKCDAREIVDVISGDGTINLYSDPAQLNKFIAYWKILVEELEVDDDE